MIYLYIFTLVLAIIGLVTNNIVPTMAGLLIAGIGSILQKKSKDE
jgi:LPXTG-motif cell wall-anchored protein